LQCGFDVYADGNQYFQYRVNFDTNTQSWNAVRDNDADTGSYARLSDMNVTYSSIVTDSCSCPASGHWQITNGDACTLSDICNLVVGDLHIVSGSLTIASTGTLNIQTGQKIIIEKDNNIVRENGSTLTINK
jgi:hypothetical protein